MRKSKVSLKSSAAFLPIGVGLLALSLTSAQAAGSYGGPLDNSDSTPTNLITINPNGSATVTDPGAPYDVGVGSDDSWVGVLNNSSKAISSLNISCSSNCFGFDGDGIDTFLGLSNNSKDTSNGGYGGANGYFTNVNGTDNMGTVNFIAAIGANGGTGYFSLENPLTTASFSSITVTPTPLPSTWTMMLIGLAGIGFAAYRTKTKQSSVAIA